MAIPSQRLSFYICKMGNALASKGGGLNELVHGKHLAQYTPAGNGQYTPAGNGQYIFHSYVLSLGTVGCRIL